MRRSTSLLTVVIVILSMASFALRAQEPAQPQRGRGGRGEQPAPAAPAGPAQKPLVPVAASTLATHPDPYYGVHVTMTGAVEAKLNTLVFSVDQDKTKSTGKEVLVLAPRMNAPVDPNTYVTVIGEVVKFDPPDNPWRAW
jgi:hypothetical protein